LFNQIPNRRITRRRQNLKDAVIAAISLVGGGFDALHKGRVGWGTLGWAVVFGLSIMGYWRGRHQDPWDPPDEDGKERHYGALERSEVSPGGPRPRTET